MKRNQKDEAITAKSNQLLDDRMRRGSSPMESTDSQPLDLVIGNQIKIDLLR